MEAKGKQDLWTQQKPEVLAALREQAIIQSGMNLQTVSRVSQSIQIVCALIMTRQIRTQGSL